MMCRVIIFELVQALKFKTTIPDENFLMLISFVLQGIVTVHTPNIVRLLISFGISSDAGGSLPLTSALENCLKLNGSQNREYSTGASDCMRQYIGDVLEFLADFHTLTKIKSYSKGSTVGLNEDTLGGVLKSGMAQFVALEITRGNNRDNRAIARYMPWLYNAPSALQQGYVPNLYYKCQNMFEFLVVWLFFCPGL